MTSLGRGVLIGLALCAATPAAHAFTVPGFELVYSYPVDTSLDRPELRTASVVWPELIASARRRLDFAEFYVAVSTKPGEPIDPVIDALRQAGARGVKIRFLVQDSKASSPEGLVRLRAIPNLELRVIDYAKVHPLVPGGILHAKYILADGDTAYVGSQNFDWRSLKHIHELGLLTTDQGIVGGAQAIFEQDWKAQALIAKGKSVPVLAKRPRPAETTRRAYLVASPWAYDPPSVGDSQSELARIIGTARQEIAVQLLDYSPLTYAKPKRFYPPIDNALRDAAVRGVKVKLMVSHWNTDKPAIDHLKSLSLIPGIEIRVVTIPEAKEGPVPFARTIHSKYMVVDGKILWLGTSNWSGGYLDDSRNLEIVVKDEVLAKEAASIHAQLWSSLYSKPLDISLDYPNPRK